MDLFLTGKQALYWATSEWSAQEIEEAHRMWSIRSSYETADLDIDVANKLGLIAPIAEQCEHQ